MTRRAPKKDDNQTEIVELVKALGGDWIQTFRLGEGAPDAVFGVPGLTIVTSQFISGQIELKIAELLVEAGISCVFYDGANIAVEIKDGSKPPSARKLTEDEQEWHDNWPGQIAIWENEDDVIEGLGRKRAT